MLGPTDAFSEAGSLKNPRFTKDGREFKGREHNVHKNGK